MPSVLIVDDLISIHEMLEAVIQPTGFSTAFATDGEKALIRYKAEKFDMVLADIDMKPMDGITLLKQLKQYDPNSVTIIMTAYASTESAVQALKFGAFDYLQKPFRVDELIATLRRGIEFREIQAQRALNSAGAGIKLDDVEGRLIGKSPQIKKLIQQVKKLAVVRTPVLLIGENGTGKSSVAEILHSATGAEPGAFRADRLLAQLGEELPRRAPRPERRGRAVDAGRKGGQPLPRASAVPQRRVQKELVSVLRNTSHAFRLVCTTTDDLEKMVDEGKFNDELFYRVASLPLQMPPAAGPQGGHTASREALHVAGDQPHHRHEPDRVHGRRDGGPDGLPLAGQPDRDVPGGLEDRLDDRDRVITSEQLPLRLRELKHWPTLAEYIGGPGKAVHRPGPARLRGDKAVAAKVLGIDVSRCPNAPTSSPS
jgi:two-component system, NtrC family, response regulator HydG